VDNAEGFDYTPTEKDLTGFYKSINGKLRVLVYNGTLICVCVSICSLSLSLVVCLHAGIQNLTHTQLRAIHEYR
jgi:hypothetical protein